MSFMDRLHMLRPKCEIVYFIKWTTKTEISLNKEILKFKTNKSSTLYDGQ